MPSTARCKYWWDDGVKFGLSVVTEPTSEPVLVTDAKDHCHIDIGDDDDWLTRSIKAARLLSETFIKRRFVTTVLRLTLDQLPAWEFYLPSPPLISVTSLKYYDISNTQQTYSASNYTVDAYTEPGRITPVYQGSWPNGIQRTNSVEVIYSAGYGAASAVPENIKLAILVAVQAWNRQREGEQSLPAQSKSLLRSEAWGFLP